MNAREDVSYIRTLKGSIVLKAYVFQSLKLKNLHTYMYKALLLAFNFQISKSILNVSL